MNRILLDWRFSFLIVPLVSAVFVYGLYKTLYPVLTYDIFPFQISSITTIKFIALLNSLLIPFAISRIYKLKLLVLVIVWISCTALALILDKGIYEGSPNSALALHLFAYQVLAIVASVTFIINVKRKMVSI